MRMIILKKSTQTHTHTEAERENRNLLVNTFLNVK